jgi:FG-GAP-like repeat
LRGFSIFNSLLFLQNNLLKSVKMKKTVTKWKYFTYSIFHIFFIPFCLFYVKKGISQPYQQFVLQTPTPFQNGESANGNIFFSDYDHDKKPDLFFIKRRNTGTKKIELHVLSGKSNYQQFIVEQGTPLGQGEDANGDFAITDFDRDGIPDLVFIKRRNTGTKTIELHIVSGKSNYQQFIVEQGTPFAQGEDANGDFAITDFDRDGIPDLVFIKRRNTGTKTIEVHILSGKSNYRQFIVERGTPFAQGEDLNGDFSLPDFDRDGVPDLLFLKRQHTGTNSIEVHILSGKSNYQQFLIERGTPFAEGEYSNGQFSLPNFDNDGVPDLAFIKQRNTGTGQIEVHVLSGASGFQQFLTELGTALGQGDGANGDFMVSDFDNTVSDLFFLKKRNTGSGKIEIHILSSRSPVISDISPDPPNENDAQSASTAGLTLSVAGDKNGLYAVSLNAGIWKCEIDNNFVFSKWRQLNNSPRYTGIVAVDPQLPEHIVAGEREGDALFANNKCGLWESFDGGKSFLESNYFNSSNICPPGNRSHAITGIIISNTSTIIASTPCGLIRKPAFGTFTKVVDGDFKAIAIYQDWMVARTATSIFVSNDDGKTWGTPQTIKTSFKVNRPNSTPITESFILDNTPFTGIPEGLFSVAIIKSGTNVFVYVPAHDVSSNLASLLSFKVGNNIWNFQKSNTNLGTGLGGRFFVKSYYLNVNTLNEEVGGKSQLTLCAGQDILKARSISATGAVDWDVFASSFASGNSPHKFHSDLWDFHIDPLGWFVWASNDGGVYYASLDRTNSDRLKNLSGSTSWKNLNTGLHTQHIHSVVANAASPIANISYCTSDNDAWKISLNTNFPNLKNWQLIGGLGDVNQSYSDAGYMNFAYNVRQPLGGCVTKLDDFGTSPSGSNTGCGDLSQNMFGAPGHQNFQFIQTLAGEAVSPYLDALMLVNLPVTFGSGSLVLGELGSSHTGNNPVLIRNKEFARHPSTISSNAAGWSLVFSDLPPDTKGFWVSGGHTDPTFFIIHVVSGARVISKKKLSGSVWTRMPDPPSPISDLANFGPLFVNPYDPTMIYAVCANGIYVFNAATNRFILDAELTNLVTDAGKYRTDATFGGGQGLPNSIIGTRAVGMCPLSSMAFNRSTPNKIVCSSPFTGVFYKNVSQPWKSLSYLLPRPYTPISSVTISNDNIFIATEGRGLLMIGNF